MHCTSQQISVGLFLVEKNVINDSPPYQRESGVWSPDKQRLFIDSLFNGYDVPKIYLHDLRGKDPRYKYAVIDGKQRLHAIWQYLDGTLSLAPDFDVKNLEGRAPPPPGSVFRDLSEEWQAVIKSKPLDVVLVQNATEYDIEELFSRLNNGEPLNAAEKRNNYAGDMTNLVRAVAQLSFFKDRLTVPNGRYQHLEIAAKFLLIESREDAGGDAFCDLKKKYLDKLVKDNRKMTKVAQEGLLARVEGQLKSLNRVFGKKDALLSKQAYPPLYYLFVKLMEREYAHKELFVRIETFLETFNASRVAALEADEEDRDSNLIEFGRLMQQGTNDLNSLRTRVSILRRYFLQDYPDICLRDAKRAFSEEERFAIWILGGKKCALCPTEIKDIEELHADHKRQWAHGGPTSLKNGRALCKQCNEAEAKKVR